jgi:hypothetical protein
MISCLDRCVVDRCQLLEHLGQYPEPLSIRVDTRITFWNSPEKRDSLFRPKILARFSQDSRVKISARLASRESHRQKFRSENREKRVLLRNFVAKIASYESRRKKFLSKTRFSRVLQTNFVARLLSLANKNFVARLTRIITSVNSWENLARILSLTLISRCELWLSLFVSLANARLANCETRKLDNISHFSLLARLMRLARVALIFSREASLIFYQILARKIAKRDSLSTLQLAYQAPACARSGKSAWGQGEGGDRSPETSLPITISRREVLSEGCLSYFHWTRGLQQL